MTQKKNYRIAQINRLLQEEIAKVLLTELQDSRLRQLTVTEVRSTPDLFHAVVFVTTLGGENRETCLEAARGSAGLLRKILYPRLRIKRIPELEFRYDESLDRAEKIFRALEEMQPELQDRDGSG
jgi:ribosome-binding factor A